MNQLNYILSRKEGFSSLEEALDYAKLAGLVPLNNYNEGAVQGWYISLGNSVFNKEELEACTMLLIYDRIGKYYFCPVHYEVINAEDETVKGYIMMDDGVSKAYPDEMSNICLKLPRNEKTKAVEDYLSLVGKEIVYPYSTESVVVGVMVVPFNERMSTYHLKGA